MGIHNSMERFLATLDSFLANNGARLQVGAGPQVQGEARTCVC